MDQIGQIRSDEIRLDQIGWDQMTLGMTLGMTSHKINPKSLLKYLNPDQLLILAQIWVKVTLCPEGLEIIQS